MAGVASRVMRPTLALLALSVLLAACGGGSSGGGEPAAARTVTVIRTAPAAAGGSDAGFEQGKAAFRPPSAPIAPVLRAATEGVRAALLGVDRTAPGVVTARLWFYVPNDHDGHGFFVSDLSEDGGSTDLSGSRLVDPTTGRSVAPRRDARRQCDCTRFAEVTLDDGDRQEAYVRFAVPTTTARAAVSLKGFGAFDAVPVGG